LPTDDLAGVNANQKQFHQIPNVSHFNLLYYYPESLQKGYYNLYLEPEAVVYCGQSMISTFRECKAIPRTEERGFI
jgi:hypothetical protein